MDAPIARRGRGRPGERFAWRSTEAERDRTGSEVGFDLEPIAGGTQVRFGHHGWPVPNAHDRVSCHCWALYLQLLRCFLEHGEVVP